MVAKISVSSKVAIKPENDEFEVEKISFAPHLLSTLAFIFDVR